MDTLLTTSGMLTTSVIVLVLEALSLLSMGVILLAYRRAHRKQVALFQTLQDEPAELVGHPILVGAYVVTTIGIGIVSFYLFAFQPHLL